MTETIISLLSIIVGVLAAIITGHFNPKISFGLIGNSLIGVFGSVLFIKLFSRLGFDPISIRHNQQTDIPLLLLNLLVSAFGAIVFMYFLHKLRKKINAKTNNE